MRAGLRAILALVLGLQWAPSTGQRIWDNPFESTLRTHQNKAWTLSAGTAMMMGAQHYIEDTSDAVNLVDLISQTVFSGGGTSAE